LSTPLNRTSSSRTGLVADEREMDIPTFILPSLEEDFDSVEYDYNPEVTLESIQKSKTINFSIRANYTNWEPREAFRELAQNW
jgi:hypothetical protein